jgi:hypothetical protein
MDGEFCGHIGVDLPEEVDELLGAVLLVDLAKNDACGSGCPKSIGKTG